MWRPLGPNQPHLLAVKLCSADRAVGSRGQQGKGQEGQQSSISQSGRNTLRRQQGAAPKIGGNGAATHGRHRGHKTGVAPQPHSLPLKWGVWLGGEVGDGDLHMPALTAVEVKHSRPWGWEYAKPRARREARAAARLSPKTHAPAQGTGTCRCLTLRARCHRPLRHSRCSHSIVSAMPSTSASVSPGSPILGGERGRWARLFIVPACGLLQHAPSLGPWAHLPAALHCQLPA